MPQDPSATPSDPVRRRRREEPAAAAPTPWEQRTRLLLEPLATLPGALLPMLHALLERDRHVDDRAIPVLADLLNLSRAEVVGVVEFYPDFRRTPPGRHVLRICHAESCQAMGGDALAAHVQERLGIAGGETTLDGRITLEPVYCLGDCALSPAVMLDDHLHGRMTPVRADRLLDALP